MEVKRYPYKDNDIVCSLGEIPKIMWKSFHVSQIKFDDMNVEEAFNLNN